MRKLNISVAKSYTDKNTNAVKTKWINIGSLVIGDDGKVFGEIEAIPVGITELKFNCFDRDDNRQGNYSANPNTSGNTNQSYSRQQQNDNRQQPAQTYQAPHGDVPIYNEPDPRQYNGR